MRIVLSIAVCASLLLCVDTASAKRMRAVNPAMVCVPSGEGTQDTPILMARSSSGSLCLLNLSPWFAETSFELTPKLALTPRAVPKRWGAELELRF